MKIILLHGDDTRRSYERLIKFVDEAKSRNWEIAYLGESDLSISENLSASSLFPNQRFFVLRDITRLAKRDFSWLKKSGKGLSGNLVIYHAGLVPASLIRSLAQPVKVEEFKLPRLIFAFLDSIYPKNSVRCLKLFHHVLANEAPEYVFALLARHLRDLYWVKVDSQSLPYPSWRVNKLKVQSAKFLPRRQAGDVDLLKNLISELARIDVEAKTGKADLISSLDLLFLTKLE